MTPGNGSEASTEPATGSEACTKGERLNQELRKQDPLFLLYINRGL